LHQVIVAHDLVPQMADVLLVTDRAGPVGIGERRAARDGLAVSAAVLAAEARHRSRRPTSCRD
jgi:hypothetical protein